MPIRFIRVETCRRPMSMPLVEKIPQHPAARKREVEMQLVDPAHDGQIGRRHRAWQVVDAAPADPERFGLLADAAAGVTVDHRFALSSPALLSAPDKKSLVQKSRASSGTELVLALIGPATHLESRCVLSPQR